MENEIKTEVKIETPFDLEAVAAENKLAVDEYNEAETNLTNLHYTPSPSEVAAKAPIGTINPVHKYFWRGNDINGTEHVGSGDDASKCNIEAGLQGSATCHLRNNPDWIDPDPDIQPTPVPKQLNAFYAAGHADGLRYFEDIKALVLAWATEQNLSGGLPDVEALPFVIYARYNP